MWHESNCSTSLPRLAEGLLTHLERQSVSVDLSVAQWHGYVHALAAHGWEPVVLPALDECPDGVFVEDTLVVRDDLAVITRPMHPSRHAEVASAQAAVEELGYRLAHIKGPGFLEGGDVLTVGSRTYVGLTLRTNRRRRSVSRCPRWRCGGCAHQPGAASQRRSDRLAPWPRDRLRTPRR